MLVSILSWIIEVYNGLFTSTSVLETFSTYDKLFSKLMDDSRFTNIVAVITTVGVSVMILYFLIDMAQKASSKNFNYEYFIKSFIKLALAYMLISNSMTIIQYMIDAGSALAEEISGMEASTSFFSDATKVSMLKKGLKKIGPIDSVGYMIKIFISWLVVIVANISVTFIAVSRLVELSVRAMFAPVGVADLFGDGGHAAGIRYLKKILALALQFALVVIITDCVALLIQWKVGPDAVNAIKSLESATGSSFSKKETLAFLDAITGSGKFGSTWLTCMGLTVTKIGLLFKAIGIANDVAGV